MRHLQPHAQDTQGTLTECVLARRHTGDVQQRHGVELALGSNAPGAWLAPFCSQSAAQTTTCLARCSFADQPGSSPACLMICEGATTWELRRFDTKLRTWLPTPAISGISSVWVPFSLAASDCGTLAVAQGAEMDATGTAASSFPMIVWGLAPDINFVQTIPCRVLTTVQWLPGSRCLLVWADDAIGLLNCASAVQPGQLRLLWVSAPGSGPTHAFAGPFGACLSVVPSGQAAAVLQWKQRDDSFPGSDSVGIVLANAAMTEMQVVLRIHSTRPGLGLLSRTELRVLLPLGLTATGAGFDEAFRASVQASQHALAMDCSHPADSRAAPRMGTTLVKLDGSKLGGELARHPGLHDVVFSPGGQLLAGLKEQAVTVLDAHTGAMITCLPPSKFLAGPAAQLDKMIEPVRVAWGAGVTSRLHITASRKAQHRQGQPQSPVCIFSVVSPAE